MSVLFQRPLLIFLLAGLGCAVLAVTGLVDAVRRFRTSRRTNVDDPAAASTRPGLRLAASLVIPGVLAFVAAQMLGNVLAIAPRMSQVLDLVGSPAPDFSYALVAPDAESGVSTPARLSQLRDHVVLLNVWATWCGPCRGEMPDLDRLQKTFGERGLTVLQVSHEDASVVRAWLAEHPMSTRQGQVESLPFPTPALPTTLVIDRRGIVRQVMVGASNYESFRDAVESWL